MREIKYRAWDIDNKCWIYSDHLSDKLEIEQLSWFFGFIVSRNVILEQYTGLLDKSGKRIYEGDRIKYEIPNGFSYGEINFEDGHFRFNSDGLHCPAFAMNHDMEIIGNIHKELKEE